MAKKRKKKKRRPGSRVVSILFPKRWSAKRARTWAGKHRHKLVGRAKPMKRFKRYDVEVPAGRWEVVGSEKTATGPTLRYGVRAKAAKKKKAKKKSSRSSPSRVSRAGLVAAVEKSPVYAGRVERVSVRKLSLPPLDGVEQLGSVRAIEYRSEKYDGRATTHRHPFRKKEAPMLLIHRSRRYIILVPPDGKRFRVTNRGIH